MSQEPLDEREQRETEASRKQGAARVTRRWPLYSGGAAVLLVAGLGAIIAYRDNNLPFSFDLAWMGEVLEHRSPFWTVPALVMNNIGGGLLGALVIPVLIVATFLVLKRPWAALFFAIATIVSAGLVQLLKNLYGRPRPQDILVSSDFGSFPSGHVANAATMAVVLGIMLVRTWVWIAGAVYTIVMLVSRTYLGAHWLSDTLGGLVLGSAVAVIVWAPLAYRLRVEQTSRAAARRGSPAR